MANTIDWGQGAVNNTNNWGKGKTNATNNWGAIYDSTAAGETNITGSGGVTPFTNTYSMSFDGVDEYFTVSDNDNLSFGNGTTDSPFSISAWIKMDTATSFSICSKYSSTNNLEYQFNFVSGGRLIFRLFDGGSTVRIGRLTADISSNVGSWTNVVATYDGSSTLAGIKIYVNNSRADVTDSSLNTYVAMHNTSAPFEIGRYATSYADGLIDEVAIFNTELSASDVTAIYNLGVPTSLSSYPSLVSWWRMGDNDTWGGSSWTLTDNGSGGNDATSVNMEEADRLPISPNSYTQNSFSFDGVDERFYVGTTSLGITNAITVSAWVKIPTTNTGGGGINIQVIACEDTTSSGSRNWNLFWRGTGYNYFAWVIFHTNLSVSSITSTGVVPNDGQWHHLLGTYDGTTNANGIKLYIDGVLNAQGTATSTGVNNYANTETTIGALTGGVGWRLEGTIDEVAVWNSDQSSNISTIFNNGVPTDISSLSPLGHWRMGENATWNGSTWTLTDQGSGANNATSVNMEEADKTGDQPYVI